MGGARQSVDSARAAVGDALAKGRRRTGPAAGPRALMAMQRAAGNSAVNALMAARLRWPGDQARSDIDGGLRELKKDEPNVDTLEKGLKAAKNLGIPVDLEGMRPPASALAVTTTGFGPGQVAPKRAVPPKKPVPAKSPLGRAAAKPAKPAAGGPAAAPPVPAVAGGAAPVAEPATLSGEQLLQPPVRPPGVEPESDPAFTAVTKNVAAFGRAKRAHPPAAAKAKEAQDAALAPTDDVTGQAKAAKADSMDAQPAGTFDKKAFIAAVKTAIEAKSPKTLKEADDYKKSGKAKEVKGEVKGLVTQGKEGQAKDIEGATEAPPDPSKAVPKEVTPMGPESPGSAVAIPAAGAVPKPAPAEQLNLEAGKHEANQEMADGEVTEEQLAESNEPQFEQALADKKTAAEHADKAPGEYRQQEQQVIEQGKADANAETKEGVAGMQGAKAAALAKVVADKGKTKSKDEQKRAEVTAKVQAIFDATEAAVTAILDGIDPKVEKAFEVGEAGARQKFEAFVSAKMSAYKKDRYGGWTGKFRWLRDKIKGMPAKVNEFYVAGRELYLKEMDRVISDVADIVGKDLTAAKTRIAAGKNEITTYVKGLPKNLQKVGSEASKEIGERFEQLESDVDSKQESVVDTLATKYVAARKGLDERIEELQAENRGLIDKAIGAIKAVINTIRELVSMLKNVLARVAGVVGQIVKAPVKFLGNLIDGIKGGILKFKDNFLAHLRKGLLSWLFGALAEGGVELPETFDLKGVIKLLASLFGLTWRNIRDRIVKQIGEKAMAAVETGVDIFQKLAAGGVGALWEMLLEKLGDIKEMILEQVKDFVLTKIITAGITWLISLLNPAAAFIKACKLIYDVVMFFVNNASRIAKFVTTILDSVSDIVRGNISGVVAKIEDVLSQMVPIIIGFLASVIGLGGIGQKIREIVQKLQKPVNKALDFVIKTGLKLAGPVIRGISGIAGKVKGKIAAGKAYVKGKVEAGKQWVKKKIYGGDDSPEGKEARVLAGVRSGVKAANRFAGKPVGERVLKPLLGGIRVRYGLGTLIPVRQERVWAIKGSIQRMTVPTMAETGIDEDELTDAREARQAASKAWKQAEKDLKPLQRKMKSKGAGGMTADQVTKGKAQEVAFQTLDKEYETNRDRLDEIQKKKLARAGELQTLADFFRSALTRFETISKEIESAGASPTQLQAQADLLRKEIDGLKSRADGLVSDPRIEPHVKKNPNHADLARQIDRLAAAVNAGITAWPKEVTDVGALDTVRALKETANQYYLKARDADRIKELSVQVDDEEETIKSTIADTINGTLPDPMGVHEKGSSEAAVNHEVSTGTQVGGKWHGEKCGNYVTALTNAEARLKNIGAIPSAAGLKSRIDALIKQSEARRAGLQAGAKAWRDRATNYPAIWTATGELRNKGTT